MNLKEGFAKKMIRLFGKSAAFFDVLLFPITLIAVVWFRIIRFWGVKKMPLTKNIFLKLGVFPIVDHYYEPLFDYRKAPDLSKDTYHLNFNDELQLNFLRGLNFSDELRKIPQRSLNETEYRYENGSFESGDAELYYSIIRKNKPKRILEIGSGFSTLIALKAIEKNTLEDLEYSCDLICVEPFEMPYLEKLGITLIREKIEMLNISIFQHLNVNDILFVDSSHIQRPGGDVTTIILKVLPILKLGVWVHFHDIFIPKGYPKSWLRDEFRLWNEQYLVEAFLIENRNYEIVLALNYIHQKYPEFTRTVFPLLGEEVDREPGSFWMRRK